MFTTGFARDTADMLSQQHLLYIWYVKNYETCRTGKLNMLLTGQMVIQLPAQPSKFWLLLNFYLLSQMLW